MINGHSLAEIVKRKTAETTYEQETQSTACLLVPVHTAYFSLLQLKLYMVQALDIGCSYIGYVLVPFSMHIFGRRYIENPFLRCVFLSGQ